MISIIYQFSISWKELITKVFGQYPLAAALITILAVAAFIKLQTEWRRGRTSSNVSLVFLGWLVLVPIFGFVMIVLGKLWAFIEVALPFMAKILGSFYGIYEHHPYMVLITLALGIVCYFAWNRLWPRRPEVLQNRFLRILCIAAGIVIAVHVASPLADLFSPTAITASQPADQDTSATVTIVTADDISVIRANDGKSAVSINFVQGKAKSGDTRVAISGAYSLDVNGGVKEVKGAHGVELHVLSHEDLRLASPEIGLWENSHKELAASSACNKIPNYPGCGNPVCDQIRCPGYQCRYNSGGFCSCVAPGGHPCSETAISPQERKSKQD